MTLSLPFMCMIPDNVQYDDRLSDSCKLYFGQIFPLTTRCGYLWATDRQLAEMKGCSIRTIERFNTELERLGYIRREVQNFPIKNENGEWSFEKRRKIYILSGVFNTHTFLEPRTVENTPKVDQPQQMAVPKEIFEKKEKNSENSKNSFGTATNCGILGTAENGGINNKSLNDTLKLQCAEARSPAAVVVSSQIFQGLELSDSLMKKLLNTYSKEELITAVNRCKEWKGRPNDECGIMTALNRQDSWKDSKTTEQKEQDNKTFLNSLNHLDGKTIGGYMVVVCSKHIEFNCGMVCNCIEISDPDFKRCVTEKLELLYRNEERKLP